MFINYEIDLDDRKEQGQGEREPYSVVDMNYLNWSELEGNIAGSIIELRPLLNTVDMN
jgi:hypothetical protein